LILWIDAQLSPRLAPWIQQRFGIDARAIRDLNLLRADDERIFLAARAAQAVVLTKDRDFVRLLARLGPPPAVIWVTCGNTSNSRLEAVLSAAMPKAMAHLHAGDSLVEIRDSL
jgi:predicted nuclease of predicted toxin-antitoxin system